MRIDGVVADHPGDRAGVEQEGRRIEPAEHRRPSHQRAPRERQAEHDLRPIGHPLHERIDRDHGERGQPDQDGEAVELQQDREPDQRPAAAGTRRRPRTPTCPEGIGRERVRSTRASRSRSTMSFQVQPAPRIANAPMKNSSTCQRLTGCAARTAAKPGRPPAGQQQAARRRSAGRGGRAADRGAPTPARVCRPSYRLNRRRVRPPGSSRQGIALERIEGAAAPWCWCCRLPE